MGIDILVSTEVRKNDESTTRLPGIIGGPIVRAVGLRERMLQVLDWKHWSDRQWAREAKLSEETHVTQIIRRLTKNPDAGVDARTLEKLAIAAKVSLDWLVLGHGTPEIFIDADYPSRGPAVTAARTLGYSERAISEVLAMTGFPGDPGVDFWMAQLQAAHLRHDTPGMHPPRRRKNRR